MKADYGALKSRIGAFFYKKGLAISAALRGKKDVDVIIDKKHYHVPYINDESRLEAGALECFTMARIASKSQAIVFRSQQAEVFTKINESYVESIDYRLPFENVLLLFDSPVVTKYELRTPNDFDRGNLLAIGMFQKEFTRDEWFKLLDKGTSGSYLMPEDGEYLQAIKGDAVVSNQLCFLYGDWGCEYINWLGGNKQEWLGSVDDVRKSMMLLWKNLAIACIGYINCENIYLHKEGEVSEAINVKRERKGKSKLEPYYVCRIRGVQYDSDGYEKGAGVKHGIRYDVRGHFRRLETGKTIWVRPHQRGLQNELYVPKTYVVAKEQQP